MKKIFKGLFTILLTVFIIGFLMSLFKKDEKCNHSWSDGEVLKEATCLDEGEKLYECELCGETKMQVVSKMEHSFVDFTCTICGMKSGSPYAAYEEEMADSTPVIGNVFRFYKEVDFEKQDGNFLVIIADLNVVLKENGITVEDYSRSFNYFYIGVLHTGELVASFEPIVDGYGLIELTEENTTIKIYETAEYYDIAIEDGATITFDGSMVDGYNVECTYTFNGSAVSDTWGGSRTYFLVENETLDCNNNDQEVE